jgi:hypothetical protein
MADAYVKEHGSRDMPVWGDVFDQDLARHSHRMLIHAHTDVARLVSRAPFERMGISSRSFSPFGGGPSTSIPLVERRRLGHWLTRE